MQEKTDLLQALDRAVRAEENARAFYLAAAERTGDPAGARMFRDLAAFEEHHRSQLLRLRDALAAGNGWIAYEPRPVPEPGAGAPGERAAKVVGDRTGALDALRQAIEAERRAEAEYRDLAAQAPDARGQAMFARLAEEEAGHRRLLDDQYFALANRGAWAWGD